MNCWPSGVSKPTFLVLGAAKAGTTSVYHYLAQHPDVFVTKQKETNYFSFAGARPNYKGPGDSSVNEWSITELDAYASAYAAGGGCRARGEVCPSYLYIPEAAYRIAQTIPDARLVVLLRNPADRAYSNFLHLRAHGREPLRDFDLALAEEAHRRADGWEWFWRYADVSRYGQQLTRYFERFAEEQILVVLFEDFQRAPAAAMRRVFAHIGVDPTVAVDVSARQRTAAHPRSRLIAAAVHRPSVLKTAAKGVIPGPVRSAAAKSLSRLAVSPRPTPQMSESTRAELMDELRSDIERTEDALHRSLKEWLSRRVDRGLGL